MSIYEHINQFAGKPVADWEAGKPLEPEFAYRIGMGWDEDQSWTDKFATFLSDPTASAMSGLVVGTWSNEMSENDSERVVEALVSARAKLPHLKALFLGDIISEENEISWINQSDLAPLLAAYPELEYLTVRGGNNLSFGSLNHQQLKSLIVQSGGLGRVIVQQIAKAHLPQLEHLELWLGTANYGADTTVADFLPILAGQLFPKLSYLGLRDSEIADDLAKAVATAPILERIKILDLSMGTLGDVGATALLESALVRGLQKLDVHHHYCSDEVAAKLAKLPLEVDVSEPETAEEDDYRYVAVSE